MLNFIKLPSRFYYFCSYIANTKPRLLDLMKPTLFLPICCSSPVKLYSGLHIKHNLLENNLIVLNHLRYKSKDRNKNIRAQDLDDEDDEDEGDEKDELQGKDGELKTISMSSVRVDTILKAGLGSKRKKIEEAFYENKLRLNGKKVVKKGTNVKVGDELDIIKGVSPDNPDFLIVGRVEILGMKPDPDKDGVLIKVRKSKSLLIENYESDHKWATVEEPSQY